MNKNRLLKRSTWLFSLVLVGVLALSACSPSTPAATETAAVPVTGGNTATDTAMPTVGASATDTTMPTAGTSATDTAMPSSGTTATDTPVPSSGTTATDTAMPSSGTPTAGTTTPVEATINVATDPTLGKILVGNNGMTLYAFTSDGPNQSNCTAACLKAWPPLTTLGSPTLGTGVDQTLVGTATLADGSKIVTYNKMPLYYFAKDTKAGDVGGQKVAGTWFVVSPDGKMVGK
jgi:predicted lipoprotein with Yx(FWY)xxD motif